jgi:NAD(P)-dependent dehydrogenase (short-subunit alcohol dehydrogenase family)
MHMTDRLAGKVAIVTGAGSGIGQATARAFAAEGARVLCADIHDVAARETAESIGPQAQPFAVDVTQPEAVAAMVDRCLQHFGRVDVLFANAGIGEAGSAIDLTLEQWNRMLAINLTSVWLCAKAVLPPMLAQGSGVLIHQSSTAGLIGIGGIAHYSAAKAGVIGLTRQIAVEYGPRGIRCNAICPSTIPTPLVTKVWQERGAGSGSTASLAEQQAAAAARHPLRRLGRLDDAAQLAVFLASEESAWITGQALALDGGLTIA